MYSHVALFSMSEVSQHNTHTFGIKSILFHIKLRNFYWTSGWLSATDVGRFFQWIPPLRNFCDYKFWNPFGWWKSLMDITQFWAKPNLKICHNINTNNQPFTCMSLKKNKWTVLSPSQRTFSQEESVDEIWICEKNINMCKMIFAEW